MTATVLADTEAAADPMESHLQATAPDAEEHPVESNAVQYPEQSSAMPSSAQIEPADGPACFAEKRIEKHIRVTAIVF